MRGTLDRLYDAAGLLAALCLIGILAMVLLGIAGRILHFHVPGTDAYAGYFMAAAGFMALAHTLARGEHIRVTLVVERLTGRRRRALELWALVVGAALAGLLAWYSTRLAWQSYDFHDISTANDATPLWIPQISMALGTAIFFVAMVDELVRELRGMPRRQASQEPLHNE